MKKCFVEKKFSDRDQTLINVCNQIIELYRRQGYDLSLRQLYYALVSRNVIPNRNAAYEWLGRVVSDARLAGQMDWDMITDRGRVTQVVRKWKGPSTMLRHSVNSYVFNRWKRQANYIEVMVEKQALEGVIGPVCASMCVNFTSNKGYSSQSAMYEASVRILRAIKRGKAPVVLYLGDHDPSGIDMTRDVRDRLTLFVGQPVDVKRLALNKSQVDEHKLPPNPAKMSDSRSDSYVAKYGRSSWELDALPPNVLAGLVKRAILRRIDMTAWNEDGEKEKQHKKWILAAARHLSSLELGYSDTSGTLPQPPK